MCIMRLTLSHLMQVYINFRASIRSHKVSAGAEHDRVLNVGSKPEPGRPSLPCLLSPPLIKFPWSSPPYDHSPLHTYLFTSVGSEMFN